ncbi:MAG: DNA polymerase III subunit epsilon [Gammaproteobacteria bacterium]|nr:MAG: DNA polymerase III subunit epsilon [Gammaproteobacteria bacterium]
MLQQMFGLEARRKRLLRKAPEGPIKDFLSVPFPDPKSSVENTSILAVDFETTGLDPVKDQILSVGSIVMNNSEIVLSSAYHQVICVEGDLKEENVVIHQITDDAKSKGEALEQVITDLLNNLAGKVMLVHFARIERNFLQRACKQLWGVAPVFPIIDTLMIAKRRLDKRGLPYQPSELRLSNLRDWHELPHFYAHNALNDALATAEVLMAEIELAKPDYSPPLKSILL